MEEWRCVGWGVRMGAPQLLRVKRWSACRDRIEAPDLALAWREVEVWGGNRMGSIRAS
jgi:hypothetical protein